MNKNNQSTLVTLREFANDVEAHIAKGILESNGIACILNDELMSSIYPMTFTSIGGIKLLVRQEDATLALQILDQASECNIPRCGDDMED